MSNLSKKVQNFAHKNDLFCNKQKIVVGVSGGADSVCLLNIFLELAKKYHFSLHIAHVNYDLRGKDSQKDQYFVEDLARKNNLEISILKTNKPKKASSLENELRNIRYDFFEKTRKSLKYDVIAIAHNQDDQAETVLMRILRGAGLHGISSIRAKNGRIVRPLLSTSRKEILLYLKEKKIKFRTDKTNLKPLFKRNKIRPELIPYLEDNFNPKIKESLVRLAEISGSDYGYISLEAKRKFRFEIFANNGIKFSSSNIQNLHPDIFREGLRIAIAYLKKDLDNIDIANLEEIEKIIKSGKNKTKKTSFKGLKIEKKVI